MNGFLYDCYLSDLVSPASARWQFHGLSLLLQTFFSHGLFRVASMFAVTDDRRPLVAMTNTGAQVYWRCLVSVITRVGIWDADMGPACS